MKRSIYADKPIGFGKYKNLTGQEVLNRDRSYAQWLYETDGFEIKGDNWEAPPVSKTEMRTEYIDHGGYTDDEWMEMGDFYGGPFY